MKTFIVERNLDLVAILTRYILERPNLLDRLPTNFQLVILHDNDPELSRCNLDLLRQQDEPEKPVVIVRLTLPFDRQSPQPHVYAPVTA